MTREGAMKLLRESDDVLSAIIAADAAARRECAEIARIEHRSALCSPAGLDHNGDALGENIAAQIMAQLKEQTNGIR